MYLPALARRRFTILSVCLISGLIFAYLNTVSTLMMMIIIIIIVVVVIIIIIIIIMMRKRRIREK